MARDLDQVEGITFLRDTQYIRSIKSGNETKNNQVITNKGEIIECKHLINAAG